jgi:4-aminobutyrate aminotransferase-like enzyme
MAVGTRIIEKLESEGFLGRNGRIARLGCDVAGRIDRLREKQPGAVGLSDGVGAMHAFVPFDGSHAVVSAVLRQAFDEGVFVFSAGAAPARVRLLPPVDVTPAELDEGFAAMERALDKVARDRAPGC